MHRKKKVRKKQIFLVSFIVVVLLVFISVIHAETASTEGILSVSFGNGQFPGTEIDTSELEALIAIAEALKIDTDISIDGTDIPRNRYWATQDAHEIFQEAIDEAEMVLQDILSQSVGGNFTGLFTHGEYFHMILRLDDNPGFATMGKRLFIPDGLELTHVHILSLQGKLVTLPYEHCHETGQIVNPVVGATYIHVVFMGVRDFTVPNSDLLVYTFRVTENAQLGETESLTLAFANAQGSVPPFDSRGRRVNIVLPNNGSGILGRITIE